MLFALTYLDLLSSSTEKLMVTMPAQHVVAIAGGQAELTCQLSPPRSAELMEIHWFRGDHSKPVYLYRGGQEENGEADPEYVGRVEFVKETIGEGQVTLRINNISISDEGSYQCSFEDNGFSDMASLNLSVAGECGILYTRDLETPLDRICTNQYSCFHHFFLHFLYFKYFTQ